jgi:WD40 repeat protein
MRVTLVAAFSAAFLVSLDGTGLRAAEPPITAIAFAPDGRSVAIGSQRGVTIKAWPSLKELANLPTNLGNVHDLQYSPNRNYLAIAGGPPAEAGILEIYDLEEKRVSATLKGHDDSVMAVAWRDDKYLATAGLDNHVNIWNHQDEQLIHRLAGHSKGVTTVCFLGDGMQFVTAGLDQNIRVWDFDTGKLLRTLNNHKREVHQVSARPVKEGLPMVASISEDRTVRLWQPTIGRMVRFAQLRSTPLSVAWTVDGSRVVVAGDDGKVVWIDPDTVEIERTEAVFAGWARVVAVHPGDGSIAVGGPEGQVKRVQ